MKNSLIAALLLISIVIFGIRISKGIVFDQNVSGYLERAAGANTVELAHEELTKVVNYLEAKNITSGYTSVFYKTPDKDIDFWYRNLKASQTELQKLNSQSALEKTNVLLKLRETLVGTGEKPKAIIPEGLSVFPHNKLWAFLMLIATLAGFTSLIMLAMEIDKKSKDKKTSTR